MCWEIVILKAGYRFRRSFGGEPNVLASEESSGVKHFGNLQDMEWVVKSFEYISIKLK